MWKSTGELEGRAEIYLRWPNLLNIALMMTVPLVVALFFSSFIVKCLCWIIALSVYMNCLRIRGSCVMAVAVAILPWYIFFEWNSAPIWGALIAGAIALVEISYIKDRMQFIAAKRDEEGILI
jgi:hypothetical protein